MGTISGTRCTEASFRFMGRFIPAPWAPIIPAQYGTIRRSTWAITTGYSARLRASAYTGLYVAVGERPTKRPHRGVEIGRVAREALRDEGRLLGVIGHESPATEEVEAREVGEAARDHSRGEHFHRESERVTEGGAEQRAHDAIEEIRWGGAVTKARGG